MGGSTKNAQTLRARFCTVAVIVFLRGSFCFFHCLRGELAYRFLGSVFFDGACIVQVSRSLGSLSRCRRVAFLDWLACCRITHLKAGSVEHMCISKKCSHAHSHLNFDRVEAKMRAYM